MIERVDQFGRDWPLYRKPLHQVATVIEQKMANFEEHVSEIEPGSNSRRARRLRRRVAPRARRGALALKFAVRSCRRRDLRALPAFLHARRQTPGLARHHAVISRHAPHRGEGNSRGRDHGAAQLCGRHGAGGPDSRRFQLALFLGHGSRLSVPARLAFRPAESDSLSRRGSFLGSADPHRHQTISHARPVHRHLHACSRFSTSSPTTC